MPRAYTLDKTFIHRTKTHEYRIQWTRLEPTDVQSTNPTTAPPLILIHGTPWSSFVWQALAQSLSSRYTIYLYDHPGFGTSPAIQRISGTPTGSPEDKDLDASLTLRAEASAALFKHWALPHAPHVVAHDNGGLVSLRLLLQHDLRFASLCLIDVVAFSAAKESLPFFNLVAHNEDVFRAIPPNLLEGFVRAYVRSATFNKTALSAEIEDELSAPWLESGKQGCGSFIREMVQAHHRDAADVQGQYARVGEPSGPIKVVWGKEDEWIPWTTAERLGEVLGAEEVVVVPEAGHLIMYDQPSRLAVEVGLWLGRRT